MRIAGDVHAWNENVMRDTVAVVNFQALQIWGSLFAISRDPFLEFLRNPSILGESLLNP